LVRQLVTREGGEPDEQTCLALASDAWGEERPEPAVVQKLISRVADQPAARDLDVRAWILVNERIRATTEAQGLKVYERPGAH